MLESLKQWKAIPAAYAHATTALMIRRPVDGKSDLMFQINIIDILKGRNCQFLMSTIRLQ